MFKHLFKYWYNPTDTPNIESKLNVWFFLNIRVFKLKLSKYIYYFILNLKNLKIKKIKINQINSKVFNLNYIIVFIFFILNFLLYFI
jgi:hypothetical protein